MIENKENEKKMKMKKKDKRKLITKKIVFRRKMDVCVPLKKDLDVTLYVSFPYYEVNYLDILTPSLSFPRYGLIISI